MKIEFTSKYVLNDSSGVNFLILVDGDKIICFVTPEALQDIDPTNRFTEPLSQFIAQKINFENIAKQKILNNEVVGRKVYITTNDI
jgi:hypothetical protein